MLTCTGGGAFSAANKTVVVDSNQTVVCTYTNTRTTKGTIELIKKVTGTPGTDDASTSACGGNLVSTSQGSNGCSATTMRRRFCTVNTGTYSCDRSGAGPPGRWRLHRVAGCINKGVGTPDTDGSIIVAKDDAWVCTFTNVKKGKITVAKVTDPGSTAGPFGFTSSYSSAFNLNGGDSKTVAVAPGSYTATEDANADYILSSVGCTDNDSTGNTSVRTATFNVAAGENVTCTFTNTKKPKLELKKATVPTSDTGTFNLLADDDQVDTQVTANGVDGRQGSGIQNTVNTGTYSLSEMSQPATRRAVRPWLAGLRDAHRQQPRLLGWRQGHPCCRR